MSADSPGFYVLFFNTMTFRMSILFSHEVDKPKQHDDVIVTPESSFYGAIISTDKMSSHCKHS